MSMKTKHLYPAAAIAFSLFISGCGSSAYSITNRSEGSGMKVVEVNVPADSTQSDIQGYVSEISSSEKVEGKGLMINFFNGGTSTSNMLATYDGSSLTMTTAQDRQESAAEGD